jgi:hypothetical protein
MSSLPSPMASYPVVEGDAAAADSILPSLHPVGPDHLPPVAQVCDFLPESIESIPSIVSARRMRTRFLEHIEGVNIEYWNGKMAGRQHERWVRDRVHTATSPASHR